jgi:ubiquinone/menaquinone biosynthesis C-methylase UbiE
MADLSDSDRLTAEAQRIRRVYEQRRDTVPSELYSVANPGALFMYQQRVRNVTRALARAGLFPLGETRILDVGCGNGEWLVDFESWGAREEHLAGIDIEPTRVARTQRRLRDADIRQGDGVTLPWPDESFDLVLQSTVFTSILDPELRRRVAAEMARVVAPAGFILWYDFFRDNPRNPDVRSVRSAEVRSLFPGFRCDCKRVTLAPPVSRRLAPISWTAAYVLEAARVLNTHYLGLFHRDR